MDALCNRTVIAYNGHCHHQSTSGPPSSHPSWVVRNLAAHTSRIDQLNSGASDRVAICFHKGPISYSFPFVPRCRLHINTSYAVTISCRNTAYDGFQLLIPTAVLHECYYAVLPMSTRLAPAIFTNCSHRIKFKIRKTY